MVVCWKLQLAVIEVYWESGARATVSAHMRQGRLESATAFSLQSVDDKTISSSWPMVAKIKE